VTAPRLINAQVSRYQRTRVHRGRFVRGEKFSLAANLNAALADGATVSSVIWRTDNPNSVIFGAGTKNSRDVSVLVTAGIGCGATVKMQATASDGKIINQMYVIGVDDLPWYQNETAPAMGAYSVSA
jgi:hypothetical protein